VDLSGVVEFGMEVVIVTPVQTLFAYAENAEDLRYARGWAASARDQSRAAGLGREQKPI
jgi:hypothetical protein